MQAAGQRDNLRHRRNDGDGRGEIYGLVFNLVLRRRRENGDFRKRVAAVGVRLVGWRTKLARAGSDVGTRRFDLLRADGKLCQSVQMSRAVIERMRHQRADDEQRHSDKTSSRRALVKLRSACFHLLETNSVYIHIVCHVPHFGKWNEVRPN